MNTKLLLFVFITYANHLVYSQKSGKAMCEPRLTVISLEKEFPTKDLFPFFVQVYRCGGSCYIHPSDQKCSALTTNKIKIHGLFDRVNSKAVTVTITNHTSCACACVKSLMDCRLELEDWKQNQCRCSCKYPNGPPKDLACKAGFRWDVHTCRCKCDTPPKSCPPKKEWNNESCGCTCSNRVVKRCQRKQKGLDYERCECVDVQALRRDPNSSTQSKSKVYISLMIVEGIVICGLLCVVIDYIVKSKRRRFMSYETEAASPTKLPPSIADSGNISCSNGGSDHIQTSEDQKDYQTNSNGSVCLQVTSRESTI